MGLKAAIAASAALWASAGPATRLRRRFLAWSIAECARIRPCHVFRRTSISTDGVRYAARAVVPCSLGQARLKCAEKTPVMSRGSKPYRRRAERMRPRVGSGAAPGALTRPDPWSLTPASRGWAGFHKRLDRLVCQTSQPGDLRHHLAANQLQHAGLVRVWNAAVHPGDAKLAQSRKPLDDLRGRLGVVLSIAADAQA